MKVAERIGWFVLPLKWLYRGCFDWEAAKIAWLNGLGLAPRQAAARELARERRTQ